MTGGDGSGAAKRVLADAQASLIFTLRPYPNFEADYQGQFGQVPVMFTDQGEPRDPQAGKAGYSPNLVKGLSVPMGSRVLVWLPLSGEPTVFGLSEIYNWTFIWRIRSVADFRLARMAYHYPKQGPGVVTTAPDVSPGPRFIIPASIQSVVYQDPGPIVSVPTPPPSGEPPLTQQAAARVVTECFQPQRVVGTFALTSSMLNPFVPGGATGIIEQGISDSFSSIFADHGLPIFMPVDVTALGDELLIACTKGTGNLVQNGSANWDFNTAAFDEPFSLFFGQDGTPAAQTPIPDLGVYVSVINAP
jgi:hypothetical protein